MTETEEKYLWKLVSKNYFDACLSNLFLSQYHEQDHDRVFTSIIPLSNIYMYNYCRIRLAGNTVYVDMMIDDDEVKKDVLDHDKWKNTLKFTTDSSFSSMDRHDIVRQTFEFFDLHYDS